MKRINAALGALTAVVGVSVILTTTYPGFRTPQAHPAMPKPAGTLSEEELEKRREAFMQLSHRAAPGVDWKAIEQENARNTILQMKNASRDSRTGFAGGHLYGTWYERGNSNLSGRANNSSYFAGTNTLYMVTDGGCVWRTPLPTPSWTLVSDKARFDPGVIEVCPRSGGTNYYRLFVTSNKKILFTDDNGTSFDTATGINYPVAWDGNYVYKILSAKDKKYVYAAVNCWDDVQWKEMTYLYMSSNNGASFSLLKKYPSFNANKLSLSSCHNDGTIYMLGITSTARDTLYKVSSGVITKLSNTAAFTSTHDRVKLMTQKSGTTVHFYAYTGGQNLYHSSNSGSTWTLKKTFGSVNYGLQLGMTINNVNKLFYGDIEAYRSSDSGVNFTKINNWGDYYGDPAHKIHADIMNIYYSKTSGGNEFGIITCDGGAYITTDQGLTFDNISLSGHNINQLWDHMTHPDSTYVIYGGSQDQGIQSTRSGSGTGIFTSTQHLSGDYGQLRITAGTTLWAEYPGGSMYLFHNICSPSLSWFTTWNLSGTQKPNAGWMVPTSDNFTGASGENIYIGGGNMSGGGGSYLIKLTLSGSTVSYTQGTYDFRANSNNGSSGIASIGISKLSSSYLYVGAEDGTFFYSTNAGANWTRTSNFPGVTGMWLYGSSIVPAADSVEKVYFGGSGYSNPAVYVSRNHGQTFTAMGTGLPATLVNELATYKNDSFLFAATDAGPYVYVKATNRWYSLMDANVPVVIFRSVEYVKSSNTVRFGTYARGIWDLKITPAPSGQRTVQGTPNNSVPAPQIKLYPSPVKRGEFLEIESDVDNTMTVDIYDISGRSIISHATIKGGIDTGKLPAGAYVCKITIEGYTPQSKKFVVQ
jgi:hypothetical protein